jgi:cytosine/adenosine deaminase-related metal-dependent hydrolase
VRDYLDHGILPALGTDSLASNPTLSLWREMRLLAEAHPTVMSSEIFKMATLGGAEALGLGHRLGALEPGKDSDLLAVPIPGTLKNADQVCHFLVHTGDLLQPARISQ